MPGKLKIEDVEEGFRRWQAAYDIDPDAFLTPREMMDLSLDEIAEVQVKALVRYMPIRPRRMVERCGCLLTERQAERFDRQLRKLVRKKK